MEPPGGWKRQKQNGRIRFMKVIFENRYYRDYMLM